MQNNPQPHDDQKYITALLHDDTILVNEIYQKFGPAIKRMVLQNNGNASDASDIFQEAITAILENAKKGNLILTGKFEGYLYRACKNIWITRLNKKNRTFKELSPGISEHVGENSFKMLEECVLQEQRFELFEKTVAKLGKRSKELLLLSWSGKSMKEVAIILNISPAFARKSKSKIQKRLIALMRQSPEFPFLKT